VRYPRLKANLHIEILAPDQVFLIDEERHLLVQGPAAALVAPLLDGTKDVARIAHDLGARLSLAEVLQGINKFERFGHLVEGPQDPDRSAGAYWDAAGTGPQVAADRLAAASVQVLSLGCAPTAAVRAALATCGLGDGGRGGAVIDVVCVEDYLDPDLAEVNRAHLADDRAWVLVRPLGRSVWIGPLLRPGATGCWACLSQRLRGNRQVERYIEGARGDGRPVIVPAVAALPATEGVLANLLAVALARAVVTGEPGPLDGVLSTVDTATFKIDRHVLVRQPQCPVCGSQDEMKRMSGPVVLQAAPVRFRADNGFRGCDPEETIARLEHHISPLLGAVTSLTRLTNPADRISQSFVAGHNFALPSLNPNLYMLRRNLRGRSGGKGRTEAQAKASALCEAIERYTGVWRGDEPTRRASYSDLDETAVHPADLLLFSEGQYRERQAWNAASTSLLHTVPDPFEIERPVDWVTAWSLTADKPRLVPAAYCYFGHPDLAHNFFCFSDANGNAAGNGLEEAALQGFLELVERDGVALWWYNQAKRPAFDLDSLQDPYVDLLREHYRSLDRELWVLDLTTDLGIPTFAAVSRRLEHPVEDVLLGFGAHLDPGLGVLRALTEMNQFLPAVVGRRPDGTTEYWEDDPDTLAWWQKANIADDPWLAPNPAQAPLTAASYSVGPSDDLAKDVMTCVERARRAGLDVLVLDQSRPDIDLRVVKVMAPGLRHFWRRLGPGRLYEVPFRMGWIPAPVAEADLNPTSVFF